MLRSKILWGFILGVGTSVLLMEAKLKLAYSHVWARVVEVLSVPGTRLAEALNTPGSLAHGWPRLWPRLAFTTNLLIYFIFWWVCIGIISYAFTRRHPYEQDGTLGFR